MEKFIRKLLLENGKKVGDLAALLGVSRQEVYRILGRNDIRFSTFRRIANALGYEVYVGRKGERPIKYED